ncbi:CYFA0S13e02454g1_1 [Cyberlindnera fabianii]|uniref:CYFA0S13e02454g1_1 n=1 Tax=Cyberlindnera fabianii TaxID=36022 RepID=A0A061B840_CYBFA|nr:CYFA0S13e02454g1_1 [Cyberlindnera fabianii]
MSRPSQVKYLVAHVNFPHAIHNVTDLRHIQKQFASIQNARLIVWRDHLSKAGFKHHMGRSMAVYEVFPNDETTISAAWGSLSDELGSIVGVVTPEDLNDLEGGIKEQIKAMRKDSDEGEVVATANDPFFRVENHDIAKKTRLDWADCIPMVVRTQELTSGKAGLSV